MKKIIFILTLCIISNITLVSSANASVIKGKRYYIKLLKTPCGFKGDVMGKHHTKKEWRDTYKKGNLDRTIKTICPDAPSITSRKKLKSLYHFFSSFASDSGNVPSCN